MEIRPTEHADLPRLYAVFQAAIGDLYRRHSFDPPDPPEHVFVAQQGHLLAQDGERCVVAVDEARVVAFAAAWVRDRTWFLASLFVLPEFQGNGLGRRLLDRVWADAPLDGIERRLTLTDAIQPISNGLYGRRGLIPATPLLSLAGPTAIDGGHLEPAIPEPAELARLDQTGYGFDREQDHTFWRRTGEVTLWLRAGEPVAYSYAWPHGQIGPVAGIDGDAAAGALRAELAQRDQATVRAPGSSAALIAVALEAGLRFAGPPGLLLVSPPHPPPAALAIGSYTLL